MSRSLHPSPKTHERLSQKQPLGCWLRLAHCPAQDESTIVVVVVLEGGDVVVVVLVVVVLLVVVVVVVVVDDVVVVAATHWLFRQSLPGLQSPHWIGTPQPLSIEPHCAFCAGQSVGVQHTPNLSLGLSVTQYLLLQLLETWHFAPSGFPPATAFSEVKRTQAANDIAIQTADFIEASAASPVFGDGRRTFPPAPTSGKRHAVPFPVR